MAMSYASKNVDLSLCIIATANHCSHAPEHGLYFEYVHGICADPDLRLITQNLISDSYTLYYMTLTTDNDYPAKDLQYQTQSCLAT